MGFFPSPIIVVSLNRITFSAALKRRVFGGLGFLCVGVWVCGCVCLGIFVVIFFKSAQQHSHSCQTFMTCMRKDPQVKSGNCLHFEMKYDK